MSKKHNFALLGLVISLCAAAPALAAPGEAQYETHCSGCHQPTGAGVPGVFAPLAGAPFVTGDAKDVIGVVLKGRGTNMPPFGADLGDDDLAAIVSYIRSAWGNKGAAVTPADVATVRAAH